MPLPIKQTATIAANRMAIPQNWKDLSRIQIEIAVIAKKHIFVNDDYTYPCPHSPSFGVKPTHSAIGEVALNSQLLSAGGPPALPMLAYPVEERPLESDVVSQTLGFQPLVLQNLFPLR